ncbi:MAG: cell wall metabolism sensor histidine kinase WalK [Clostridiales bacterium]|nr:cell wall metabolism sensor histidine kinase WalK [Clostridiales bacterium]
MFRSLFSRLMVTYLIIMLITLITLGLFLSGAFQRYVVRTTEEELIREARELNRHYELYDKGWVSREYMELMSDGITSYDNTSIWVVRVVGDIGLLQFQYDPHGVNEEMEVAPFSKEELVNVLRGNIIKNIGRFGERFSVPVLTVGIPLKLDQRIKGAIFFHTPIEEIDLILYDIYTDIWKATLFSAALSIVLLYWISRRISKPLSQMSEVSRGIASGNYNERVKVSSKDETGQLALSFNAMADSLERLEEMRRSFVANVSHELRSPLTSIRGYIQGVIDKTFDPQEQEKYLNIALEETQRLNKLINELLNLSQIESGQFPLTFTDFDINEQIRRLIIAREEEINIKDISVEIDFGANKLLVNADPDRIQQVVINLLDNAIKFNKEAGGLLIKTWKRKGKVYVKIQDQGIGISKDEIPKIWDRFYQVEKSRSGIERGTGLGLSIVKKIIDEHDEEIWVNSQLGQGTAFIFSLKASP